MKKKLIRDAILNCIKTKTWKIMRLFAFFLLMCFSQVWASSSYSQQTKLTLNLNSSKVIDVLDEIENNSEFYFLFNQRFVDVDRKVDINVKEKTIGVILDELFKETNVNYLIKDRQIVLTTFNDELTSVQQPREISGKVSDSGGLPLPGVTVMVKGTTTGTVTGADGSYVLSNITENSILLFSFVGMKSQEIVIGDQTVINVMLEEETIGLEEVVAIGYGVQKKSIVTGAISSVTSDDIQSSSITRAEQALQGRTAGVQVISASGSPGAEMNVRIRGYSSNGKADPLYIVDGVKTNSISYLSPQDISNMEVLKDAASSAIYGAEGGNGVIIITTKSAKSGFSTIDYDFQYTLQNIGKLPGVLNSQEYANYYGEAGAFSIDPGDVGNNTEWMDEITEQGISMRHYVSFASGTDKSNFLLSLSSLDQDGIIVKDKDSFKRYTFRFNADSQLKDWLKIGNNASFAYYERKAVSENNTGSTVNSALLMDPTTPTIYTSGVLPGHVQQIYTDGNEPLKDKDGNVYGISKYISKSPANPLVGLELNKDQTTGYTLQGNMFAEIKPVDNLVFTTRFGYEVSHRLLKGWDPTYFYNSNNNYNLQTVVAQNMTDGTFWQWENFVSYTNTFSEDHNLNVLLGMSAESRMTRITNATGGPMIKEDENYAELSFISSQSSDFIEGQKFLDTKASYFGRISYDYQNKYLFQGTIRRDGAGSSLLPKENRWGIFPSFSAGWNFTEEDFFPGSFVNFGKLRASWGENGSLSNLSNYGYSSVITSTNLLYQLGDGNLYTVGVPNQLNNPQLRWETSVQTDIGIDLRMFDSRVSFTVDYFNKKTTDLITPNTPPLESGNSASAVNGGDVLNRGFEFSLEYRKASGDFNYNIMGNLATLHNEVTYLNPTIQRIRGGSSGGAEIFYTAFEEGFPVWYFNDYETDGIDPTTGEANFVDQNGDGLINEGDKTFIGSAIPDFTYGLNLNMSYKGFDFSAALQGQAGNETMILWMRNDLPGSNIPKFLYDGRWTPSNTNNATVPKAGFDTKTLNSDVMMFNGSYMRIKQIQLGYNIPGNLLDRIMVKSARVYISLDDYFTFTDHPGMDPEAGNEDNSSIGIDRGKYPTTKKALFGISVSF